MMGGEKELCQLLKVKILFTDEMNLMGGGSTGPICPQLHTIEEMKFFTHEQRTAILDMYIMACDTYIQAAVVEKRLKDLGKKP